MKHRDRGISRQQHQDARRRLTVVWSRNDFDDAVEQAVALTKDRKASDSVLGPVQLLGQYHQREHFATDDSVFNVCRRGQVGDPAAAPERDQLAPVIDLFTRQRVR